MFVLKKSHFIPNSLFYTCRWNNLLGNNQFYYRLYSFCIWSTSVTVSRGAKWRDSIAVTYLLQMSTASCCLSVRGLNKYGHPWQMTYWTAPQRVKTPESTSTGHRSDTNGGKNWRGARLQFSIRYPWLREIWLKTYSWLRTISWSWAHSCVILRNFRSNIILVREIFRKQRII